VKAIREVNRARARETFLKSEYEVASQAAMKANNDLQDIKTELETAFWNRAMERAK
jgi:chromosome segregation ATPase